MTQGDLHAKIRELMASGVLPKEAGPIVRPATTSTAGKTKSWVVVVGKLHAPCTVCGEPSPHVQHFYVAGQVVSVHAACEALWKQELEKS